MPLLSDLYNISSKGNLRGKAKESFVRPTVCQFFSGKCNYGETQPTIDFASAPNFTRSTQFTGAVGEDVIKVNDNMGVTPSDQSTGVEWGCYVTELGTGCQSDTDGASNTSYILSNCGERPIAASVCANYGDGNWYLPAINQLETIYSNRAAINSVADSDFVLTSYWSSTESSNYNARRVYFYNGNTYDYDKFYESYVRCVRSF